MSDLRIQQPIDQPELLINVDRTQRRGAGLTQDDVARQPAGLAERKFPDHPTFCLNPKNGGQLQRGDPNSAVHDSKLQDCRTCRSTRAIRAQPEILGDVASISRGTGTPAVINHYNIHRVIDIYGKVDERI